MRGEYGAIDQDVRSYHVVFFGRGIWLFEYTHFERSVHNSFAFRRASGPAEQCRTRAEVLQGRVNVIIARY